MFCWSDLKPSVAEANEKTTALQILPWFVSSRYADFICRFLMLSRIAKSQEHRSGAFDATLQRAHRLALALARLVPRRAATQMVNDQRLRMLGMHPPHNVIGVLRLADHDRDAVTALAHAQRVDQVVGRERRSTPAAAAAPVPAGPILDATRNFALLLLAQYHL